MSILTQVKKGIVKKPPLIMIFGPDGVGKSTFAASAPDPIFVGNEHGTDQINTSRLPAPANFLEFLTQLDALLKEEHAYKTLAIDSVDWMDKLVQRHVCEKNNAEQIEDVKGGYGKGTAACNLVWHDEVFSRLKDLREKRGMGIVLIAHSQVKKFKDPAASSDYDKYQVALSDTTAALFRQYVDAVLFATYEIFVRKENGKAKAYGEGARIIYSEGRPAFDAKNRLSLPFQFPLSWDEFEKAQANDEGMKPETLVAAIKDMITDIPNPKIKKNIEAKLKEFGKDPAALLVLKNKVLAVIGAAA